MTVSFSQTNPEMSSCFQQRPKPPDTLCSCFQTQRSETIYSSCQASLVGILFHLFFLLVSLMFSISQNNIFIVIVFSWTSLFCLCSKLLLLLCFHQFSTRGYVNNPSNETEAMYSSAHVLCIRRIVNHSQQFAVFRRNLLTQKIFTPPKF